ncbi:competence protein ComEA [Motilibacter rhizosphaerae]|uniref:Competence protein ComEA n=1 Tax=Motilibacter rhizosphaerae TaxID=598652 RepID=A0A4Q7NRR5_9ACTN|nr:helix-hairpin-helix domain-containing protein [Motilibacter rhizosphaerae]RZS89751.1 competence protein ComEA [Motilibacter rhizosphaerae]
MAPPSARHSWSSWSDDSPPGGPSTDRGPAVRRLRALTLPVATLGPDVPVQEGRPWVPDDGTGWLAEEPADPSPVDGGLPVPAPAPPRAAGGALLARHRAETAMSRPALLACAALAAAAALGVALAWLLQRPHAELAPPAAAAAARPSSSAAVVTGTGAAAPPSAAAAEVVVDVEGRVRRAGVVRLPAGSRVTDAVELAGGAAPRADLRQLDLARPLVDGEQLVVPAVGEVLAPSAAQPPPAAGGTAAGSATGTGAGGLLDLNAATAGDLDGLPGVGPVLAQRILDWRTAHGRFSSVDELREVGGIGDARLADLRKRVRV